MRRNGVLWLLFITFGVAVVLYGFSLINSGSTSTVRANAVFVEGSADISGFTRALEPLDWQFPANFGAHPDYQTEWWYYTGNLADETGRRFGYQFTIFRRALTPPDPGMSATTTGSEWRSNQVYMAHFTVSDIGGEQFFHEERYSRGAAGLAGATWASQIAEGQPYRVYLEDWVVAAVDPSADQTTITAQMHDSDVRVQLMLDQLKPPALQGDAGLSAKSGVVGNASHYYTLSRLATTGEIAINGQTFAVTGYTWKDHEFSTSALGEDALGWDWFGLQFDDNTEMMIGKIRLLDGGREPNFGGLFIYPDGSTRYLPADTFTITATSTWRSPHTGAEYPAGWDVVVNLPTADGSGTERTLNFTITPQIADQELHGGNIAYYEGSVRVEGDVTGFGYAELTGYTDALTGRF